MGRIKLRPRSEAPAQNSRIKRLIVQYELNKYLGHEVYNNGTASLVYCDSGETRYFDPDDIVCHIKRGIESCHHNTKISQERRQFNYDQMNALIVAQLHQFDDFIDPKQLSAGLILWITSDKHEDDLVVVKALTDVAIQVESTRPEFNNKWLPFFSINFRRNRQKLEAHLSKIDSTAIARVRRSFKDFTPCAPLSNFHYPIQPHIRPVKIHRALIPAFDGLEHLLNRIDYPVTHHQPLITIYQSEAILFILYFILRVQNRRNVATMAIFR